ncbi:MAG TPA: bifunctional metallophosphatase/5'-nucleotidase [Methanosarcina sp.]|nr:bifunctional metallophosphatase/5'-nucleotidase [Methanosarcina sp.]
MGYARITSLFKQIREENPDGVIALDNGDTIHGTFPAVSSKGNSLVPILNEIGFDAMTAHWEFAYGPDHFKELSTRLEYPVLAVNCYEKTSNKLFFPPYRIIERGGLRLGIIGIACTIVDKTMPKSFSKGIYFSLGNEELPPIIKKLREDEKADLIIVLSHLGYPQDLKLAQEVKGIDVLLSGHTHNRLYKAVTSNGTIIMQSGCHGHGSFIGKLDLEIEEGKIIEIRHELTNIDESIKADEKIELIINDFMKPYREMLNNVVGHTETVLNRYRVLETTMDNLLLQAIAYASGINLAFSNGWRYGAPIPPGPITLNDLWNIIPTNPQLSRCEITGSEIYNMMEENLEHVFSCDPYKQMGGYVKRCLGLNLYFKIENPAGKRIQELYINSEKFDPDKVYDACFVTSQGIPEHYGRKRKNLEINAIEALKLYLAKKSPVTVELMGTIVPI